jgi:hypothetical protein
VGCPTYVGADCFLTDNAFKTITGLPTHIGGALFLYGNDLTSLHNIHKEVKQINGMLQLNKKSGTSEHIDKCVLGLLMIRGLDGVDFDNTIGEIFYDKPDSWQAIVNKHINKNGNSEDNIYDCQEALIDAGHEECAKL